MIYDFDRGPSAESMLCPIERSISISLSPSLSHTMIGEWHALGVALSRLAGSLPIIINCVSDGHFKVVCIRRAHVPLNAQNNILMPYCGT